MRFTKMNGLGNDYIFLDGTEKIPKLSRREIIKLCDRNFGIGGDGVVVVTKSEKADFGMIIYNSDGSTAEMCGNALRCLAKYAFQSKLTTDKYLKIETGGGMRFVKINSDGTVTANMCKPVSDFVLTKIPLDTVIQGYKISAGNPHFVVFCSSIDPLFDLYGAKLSENTAFFPERTNVEFAKLSSSDNFALVRVYERGSGETLACGTGATAVFEAAYHFGYLKDNAVIKLRGGMLHCSHNSKGEVLIRGDADFNFIGETDLLTEEKILYVEGK